ncbi:MAG: ATP synthase F1 subunit delta [Myxococcales bacterium]|nr:ATP synthase F1 subunit delta [Myxococcales bacterium]
MSAVARRYAQAVFELAREESKLPKVVDDLTAIAAAYQSSSDFRDVELLPGLTEDDRSGVVETIAREAGAGDLAVRTVSMLAARKRLAILPDLVEQLAELADEALGVLRAEVSSAKPLDSAYRSRLQKKIEEATGKKVVMSFTEDPDLIAGIVTKIGDRVVDGSLRGKLSELAESLRQT